jgi:hypothetical protein
VIPSGCAHASFLANQRRLLERADLTDTPKLTEHLLRWSATGENFPQIFAFSDPGICSLGKFRHERHRSEEHTGQKRVAVVAVFRNPQAAHITDDKTKKVLRAMVPKE